MLLFLYKCKTIDYWRMKLTNDCSHLTSLQFLKPCFIFLDRPHPVLFTIPGSSLDARAACIQALLLTGRYRIQKLRCYWSSNKHGYCLFSSCYHLKQIEDTKHFLLHCLGLSCERRRLYDKLCKNLSDKPFLAALLEQTLFGEDDDAKIQFLLDASTLPSVISAYQRHGEAILIECFKISRQWCWSLHVARRRKLKC